MINIKHIFFEKRSFGSGYKQLIAMIIEYNWLKPTNSQNIWMRSYGTKHLQKSARLTR